MTDFEPEPPPGTRPNLAGDEDVRWDRREHGGAPARPDDDELARRTERERVEAGLEAYDPEEVPPATDPPATDQGG